jgi:hypothetical protein
VWTEGVLDKKYGICLTDKAFWMWSALATNTYKTGLIHNLIILYFASRVAFFKKHHFDAYMLGWYLTLSSLYLFMKVDKTSGIY